MALAKPLLPAERVLACPSPGSWTLPAKAGYSPSRAERTSGFFTSLLTEGRDRPSLTDHRVPGLMAVGVGLCLRYVEASQSCRGHDSQPSCLLHRALGWDQGLQLGLLHLFPRALPKAMELYADPKGCVPRKAGESGYGLASTAFAQILSAGSLIAPSSVPELGMLRGVCAMLCFQERDH